MLGVEKINSFYGLSHVLHDVSLTIGEGETVALLGRNGAGKTTTLKTIMGILKPRTGRIVLSGEDLTLLPTYRVAQKGICFIPEDRQVFPNLTVFENLKISRLPVGGGKRLDDFLDWVFTLFPPLKERIAHKGSQLSGGEQQMLTIARGLGTEPKIMLVDEPTEGLMPFLVETIREVLVQIQEKGIAILLVEQRFRMALSIASRAYLIEKGQIRWEGSSADLLEDEETRIRYLGV
ncbi:MAG: ABC transporter ATP-binding protein [Candidatus Rokubacteria bacterium]|nr:ABC transporter ATP-binding protein [Candidatus Rokubacteria bacterium]